MNDNDSAFSVLEGWIRKLAELPKTAVELAEEAAPAVHLELRQQIGRADGPDGKAWPDNKDGSKPLGSADLSGLSVVAKGSVILLRLDGFLARHNNGTARGGVRRQILPTNRIPQPMIKVLQRIYREHMLAKLGDE